MINNKKYCKWEIIRFLEENALLNNTIISIVDYMGERDLQEIMIFLEKKNRYFKVTILKNTQEDTLIWKKNRNENEVDYNEDDKKIEVLFKDFDNAIDFLVNFQTYHPELNKRPYKPLVTI